MWFLLGDFQAGWSCRPGSATEEELAEHLKVTEVVARHKNALPWHW